MSERSVFPLKTNDVRAFTVHVSGAIFGVLAVFVLNCGFLVFLQLLLIPALVLGAVAGVLWRRYLLRLEQGVVTVEIDEEGIRELDDDHVRVATRWSDARVHIEQGHYRHKSSTTSILLSRIDILAPSGDVITVNGGRRKAEPMCTATRERLTREVELAKAGTTMPTPPVDPRFRHEYGAWWARGLRSLTVLCGYACMIEFAAHYGLHPNYGGHITTSDRLSCTILFGLVALVLFVPQLFRRRYWNQRAATLAPVSEGYRVAAKNDDERPFIASMQSRARMRFMIHAAFFGFVLVFPWLLPTGPGR